MRSFSLFITIVLVSLFSLFSLSIIESNSISSNLNKLKYLHLQGNIHLKRVEEFIKKSSESEIENLTLNDTRYNMKINKTYENNMTIFYVSIKSIDEPVRLYKRIEKN